MFFFHTGIIINVTPAALQPRNQPTITGGPHYRGDCFVYVFCVGDSLLLTRVGHPTVSGRTKLE